MRTATIIYSLISLVLASGSLYFAERDAEAPESRVLVSATSVPGVFSRNITRSKSDDDGGAFISCSVASATLNSCDGTSMGPVPSDVPEYGKSTTPAQIFSVAREVIPMDVLEKFDELRIYAHTKGDTVATIEHEDNGKWRLGISLDQHLFNGGGIDTSSLEVTLAHEWGHLMEVSNPIVHDAFIQKKREYAEASSTVASTMGEEAAGDSDEDFAESWALYLARGNPKNQSEKWRMHFFDQYFKEIRKNWREARSGDDLMDLEVVWELSHEVASRK